MKKICPLCGTENEGDAKFCKECNEPLYDPHIYDNLENPYAKTKKEEMKSSSLGSKKTLDKESFGTLLFEWVMVNLKFGREKGLFQNFLKSLRDLKIGRDQDYSQGFLNSIRELGIQKATEVKFYEEAIYLHVWLAYINSISHLQDKNKIDSYFPCFTRKVYDQFSKLDFGNFAEKEENWEANLMRKINGYVDAYNMFLKGYSKKDSMSASFLGVEFYKNLYGVETLGAITIYHFSSFVMEILMLSFQTLGKELAKYEI